MHATWHALHGESCRLSLVAMAVHGSAPRTNGSTDHHNRQTPSGNVEAAKMHPPVQFGCPIWLQNLCCANPATCLPSNLSCTELSALTSHIRCCSHSRHTRPCRLALHLAIAPSHTLPWTLPCPARPWTLPCLALDPALHPCLARSLAPSMLPVLSPRHPGLPCQLLCRQEGRLTIWRPACRSPIRLYVLPAWGSGLARIYAAHCRGNSQRGQRAGVNVREPW